MPGKMGSPVRAQDGRRVAGLRASRQALAAAGLVLAVLAGPASAGAATAAHRVTAKPGSRSSQGTELAAGTELRPGSWLSSPNGKYRLAMQADGNLVLSFEGHPLWASGTAGHPGAFLALQADGDLVVYQGDRLVWSSGTARATKARYYLSVQDNGSATIYSPARKPLWATGTAAGAARIQLAAGTELRPGSWLSSPNGKYRLAMQADGNLVLSFEGHPLWASGTAGHPGAFLALQADGDLVVYQGDRLVWSSGTARATKARYYLSVQDNGSATIYSPARKPLWATGTAAGQRVYSSRPAPSSGPGRGSRPQTASTAWRCKPTATSSSHSRGTRCGLRAPPGTRARSWPCKPTATWSSTRATGWCGARGRPAPRRPATT